MTTPKQVLKEWESLASKQRTGRAARALAKKCGMKSILEVFIAAALNTYKYKKLVKKWEYEPDVWEYEFGIMRYTPDFKIYKPDGSVFYIEGKGKMTDQVRKKLRYVKKCNPDQDLRIIFERAKNKLKKGSPTSYGKWAGDNRFAWTDREVPDEWF